jgi:hypothetical protein
MQVADPIDLSDGSFYFDQPCLKLGGAGIPISIALRYSTRNWRDGIGASSVGRGWTLSYSRSIRYENNVVTGNACGATGTATCTPGFEQWRFINDAGVSALFNAIDAAKTTFAAPPGSQLTLSRNATSGVFTLKYRDGTVETYDATGRLTLQQDRLGNQLSFVFGSAGGSLKITNVRNGQFVSLFHEAVTIGGVQTWRLWRICQDCDSSSATSERSVLLGLQRRQPISHDH